MRIDPWHSARQPVHHNNASCEQIRSEQRALTLNGTGGKRLCPECARLNREGGELGTAASRPPLVRYA